MTTETRRCQHCGTAFTARVVATEPRRGRFCGLACFHAANTKYSRPERTCDGCGTRFLPTKTQVRGIAAGRQTLAFCSPACWRASLPAKYAREANPHWQGGRIESRRYQYVRQDRHPVSPYVAVHRAVAEAVLGRRLLATEVVHHRDGDEQNNAPENLEVLTRAEHARLHLLARNLVGARHPRTKLTQAIVDDIRARAHERRRVLAAEYGVCIQTIVNVIHHHVWAQRGGDA
jgi:hypothetical protein